MKYAIISDVHGNLEAFHVVLEDIKKRGIKEIFNLGDLVGYGPNPNSVTELNIREGIMTVLGNHDEALFNPRYLKIKFFYTDEHQLTLERCSKETVIYLQTLPMNIDLKDFYAAHGAPPNDNNTHIIEPAYTCGDRKAYFKKFDQKICFVGHVHYPFAFVMASDDRELRKPMGSIIGNTRYEIGSIDMKGEYLLDLEGMHKAIISVCGVGQPRDDDPRTGYMIYDTEKQLVQAVRLEYDFETTISKMKKAGFPDAGRLRLGK